MKRILLVSYHFGPACGTGGFRWNEMTAGLVERGWTFDVLTLARPGVVPSGNPTEAPQLPVEVFPVPASSAPDHALDSLKSAARGIRRRSARDGAVVPVATVRLEDVAVWTPGDSESLRVRTAKALQGLAGFAAESIWCRRAAAAGRSLMKSRRYDAIVVSSPPHFTQTVGVRLARRSGVPLVSDFRDPWVAGLGPLLPFVNATTRVVAGFHEPRVLRAADVVVYNTEAARTRSLEVFGSRVRRAEVVANGSDGPPLEMRPDSEVFRIVFAGWLYPYMDVRSLLRGAARLAASRSIPADKLRIEFLGTGPEFGGVQIRDIADACGIGASTHVLPRIPRDEAIRSQAGAAVLAAFSYPHGLAVVMKFYDYVRMRGDLLLIGPTTGALAQAAAKVGSHVVEPYDDAGIDAVLDKAYNRWLAGDYERAIDQDGIFSRKHRIAEMDAILCSLVDDANAMNSTGELSADPHLRQS